MPYAKWAEKAIKRGEQPRAIISFYDWGVLVSCPLKHQVDALRHKFQTFAGSRFQADVGAQQNSKTWPQHFDKLAMACLGFGHPDKAHDLDEKAV